LTPAVLAPYRGTPGFRSYARAFRKAQRELSRCGATLGKVELLVNRDSRSALRRFFTLEKADQADHWLSIEATVDKRPLKLVAPFRRGLTLPYSLEIGLATRVGFTGVLRRNMVLVARWDMLPATLESRDLGAQLDKLGMPSINWRHDSGGLPIVVKEASRLATSPDPAWPMSWVIVSGYQGFLFNVGPRIAKYVAFLPKLEELLAHWKPAPIPKPSPVAKPAPAAKPAAAPAAPPAKLVERTAPAANALQAAAELAAAAAKDEGGTEEEDKPLELPDESVINSVMVPDATDGKRH
jgi:hypothetical protein